MYAADDEITFESLGKLQYMERVIKETLRVAPVGPVIFREAMEDFEIEEGLVIPKGTTFVLNIYALHRQRHIWGNKADLFNPDNFLPENVAKRHPCSYIPFSTGSLKAEMFSLNNSLTLNLQAEETALDIVTQ